MSHGGHVLCARLPAASQKPKSGPASQEASGGGPCPCSEGRSASVAERLAAWLCAKHGERTAGVSDKAPGLEAPQEKHAVNQCEEAPLMCVQRAQGDDGGAGEQAAALTAWRGGAAGRAGPAAHRPQASALPFTYNNLLHPHMSAGRS